MPFASRVAFRVPRLAAAGLSLVLGATTTTVACAPRRIQVSNGPEPTAAGLAFTNNLRTAVNVYARGPGGAEVFVRQVPAQSSETLAIRDVAPGAVVSLRAAPVDGSRAYTRDNVTLGTGASWRVP